MHDPLTLQPYSRDPRNVARKAEEYLASTGIADTCFFGAEAEFYIFDDVQFETSMTGSFYKVDSEEGWWNTGRDEAGGNLGYKARFKGGYFPVPPYDHQADLREDMTANLITTGFEIERGHHEVGTGGQAEINYKFNTLLASADEVMLFKYIIKNTAWAARQDRHLHAQAAVRRQRLGHARPPVAVDRAASRCSTTRPATAGCPTWPATTSAACCTTPRRCWPSPTRR